MAKHCNTDVDPEDLIIYTDISIRTLDPDESWGLDDG